MTKRGNMGRTRKANKKSIWWEWEQIAWIVRDQSIGFVLPEEFYSVDDLRDLEVAFVPRVNLRKGKLVGMVDEKKRTLSEHDPQEIECHAILKGMHISAIRAPYWYGVKNNLVPMDGELDKIKTEDEEEVQGETSEQEIEQAEEVAEQKEEPQPEPEPEPESESQPQPQAPESEPEPEEKLEEEAMW